MKRLSGVRPAWSLFLLWLTGCVTTDQTPSTLHPQGYVAAEMLTLTYILLALGGIGFAVFIAVLAYGLWGKPRGGNLHNWIIWGGIVFPAILLAITYFFTISTLRAIAGTADDPLIIEVVGNQYWWQVSYPEFGFETANEIHIPINRPIQLELKSADVYHAFWLPELGIKRDLVPGTTNTYQFSADVAKQYWGLCSEFCGIQHANMLLLVIGQEQADFDQWVANQQQDAPAPTTELTQRGYDIYIDAQCALCHTIRGTESAGNTAPDLTHLNSRLTLGAGVTRNSIGSLGGWVANPHGIKPGVLMPAAQLTGEELNALLAYLQTLR